MTRRILIISIVAIVAVILGILAWFLFFAPERGAPGEEEGAKFFGFLPFGGGEEEQPVIPEEIEGIVPREEAERASTEADLRQLTQAPIAGAVATTTGRGLVARYVERQTGNVYDVAPDGSSRTRITNTTVPAVREALWSSDGTHVLLRYLNQNDVIRTFAAHITGPGEEVGAAPFETLAGEESARIEPSAPSIGEEFGELVGVFLDDDISFAAPSPRGDRVFYIHPLGSGIVGTTARFDGSSKSQIFDSTFAEWLPEWPEDDMIALQTKASAFAEGFLYTMGSGGGPLRKVVGDVMGLTARVSPDADRVAYSESGGGSFTLHALDITARTHIELPIATLPEKCVWSKIDTMVIYCGVPGIVPSNPYPDVWYMGLVSFTDTIWRIDMETSATNLIAIPQSVARQEIDVIEPFMDNDEMYLFFVNKKDSTLWSLKLN